MHASEAVFVFVDWAPCSVLLRVHHFTRRVATRRAILLLNANLAVESEHFFFAKQETVKKGLCRFRVFVKLPASRWITCVSSVFAVDGRVDIHLRFGSRFLHHFVVWQN